MEEQAQDLDSLDLSTRVLIDEIEAHIIAAVSTLMQRVEGLESGDGEPIIKDRRDKNSDLCMGTTQDCEFGLMVLMAHEWFTEKGNLQAFPISEKRLEQLICALLRKTVKTVTSNVLDFEGGKLAGSPVFFSGSPYTNFKDQSGNTRYSANLDAAMLIVAFLAAALAEFDQKLVKTKLLDTERIGDEPVENLRDAALLVTCEGLRYAQACRESDEQGNFLGFTSDPTSRSGKGGPAEKPIEKKSLLFFTWTVCETIHELIDWRKNYLDPLGEEKATSRFVEEIRSHLDDLEAALAASSSWAYDTFFEDWQNLRRSRPPAVGAVVGKFVPLGVKGRPDDDLESDREEVGSFVANVYHLSQYAAIRSIRAKGIKIHEVRLIADLLDNMVGTHILGSGLDAARHESLFKTLGIFYDLGNSNPQKYKDDAYLPLVVRSLAGLLGRTLTELEATSSQSEILKLIIEFRRSLRTRYENLIDRRPEPKEEGDDAVWSFAPGSPYTLYATQRTIFALIEYLSCLELMEEFEFRQSPSKPGDLETAKTELTDLLAKSLGPEPARRSLGQAT